MAALARLRETLERPSRRAARAYARDAVVASSAVDTASGRSRPRPCSKAWTAYSSKAVTKTTWHRPLTWRATSIPDSPGIWMSRKRMSGACSSIARSALDAVVDRGADHELRPELRQRVAQAPGQQAFVFGNDGACVVAHGFIPAQRRPAAIRAELAQLVERDGDASRIDGAALMRDAQVRRHRAEQLLRPRGLARHQRQCEPHARQHQIVVDRRKLGLQALLDQTLRLGRALDVEGPQEPGVVRRVAGADVEDGGRSQQHGQDRQVRDRRWPG